MPLTEILEHGAGSAEQASSSICHEKYILFAASKYCQKNQEEWAEQTSAQNFSSAFSVTEILLTVLPQALEGAMGCITSGAL